MTSDKFLAPTITSSTSQVATTKWHRNRLWSWISLTMPVTWTLSKSWSTSRMHMETLFRWTSRAFTVSSYFFQNIKQDEAHEPECRHVCWQTETILICHISSKLTCETPWIHTLRWHSCRTPLLDTLTWRSCKTLLRDTLVRHSCKTLLLDTSYLTLL